MITIFACPKPFHGHIAVIQRNAIRSWTLLEPRPEIILLGDDMGVADICDEFQLIHVSEIEKNEYGTPLVNSVFRVGQDRASSPMVCYANCDIMLMNDLYHAVRTVNLQMSEFLILGQRWDIDINQAWNFASSNWEDDLRALVARESVICMPKEPWIILFFPRGMYTDIPPLAIGRLAWDSWLVWQARMKGVPIIDVSNVVTVAHQNHDYPTGIMNKVNGNEINLVNNGNDLGKIFKFDGDMYILGSEVQRNLTLVREEENLNIFAATWVIDPQGVLKRRPFELTLSSLYYQIRWVLPLYWPAFGRLVRWMLNVRRTLLTRINRKVKTITRRSRSALD